MLKKCFAQNLEGLVLKDAKVWDFLNIIFAIQIEWKPNKQYFFHRKLVYSMILFLFFRVITSLESDIG